MRKYFPNEESLVEKMDVKDVRKNIKKEKLKRAKSRKVAGKARKFLEERAEKTLKISGISKSS